jgi:hypothetical protein
MCRSVIGRQWFFIIFIILSGFNLYGQDTVWVQGFTYGSKTRDSLIRFPAGDHNDYEKILMYYNMRCKNALVSTGSERNKGCGEWDYSCNTNIVDSTQVDSLKQLHPNYVIQGLNDNYFAYTNKPTYAYYVFPLKDVTVNASSGLQYLPASSNNSDTLYSFVGKNTGRMYLIAGAAQFSGGSAGKISGIRLAPVNQGTLSFLKIRLASLSGMNNDAEAIKNATFTEVFHNHLALTTAGPRDIVFHTPYTHTSGNLIIEISYTGNPASMAQLNLVASKSAQNTTLFSPEQTDRYLNLAQQGPATLPVSQWPKNLSEVTVCFWSRGNEKVLPNNNSAFHAIDEKGNRQLNVHLPWSNSRIYWDCGNDGTGFDRIDKAATPAEFEGGWNHWAFTKNSATGAMKIYLNGVLWHSGNGKTKPIQLNQLILGATDVNGGLPYNGDLDDFGVWTRELNTAEIKQIMSVNPVQSPVLSAGLTAWYDCNEMQGSELSDKSVYSETGQFKNEPFRGQFRGDEIFKGFTQQQAIPDISLIRGNYTLNVQMVESRDSVRQFPRQVIPYEVKNNLLVAGNPFYVWEAGYFPVYDDAGAVIDEVEFPADDVIFIEDLTYYQKSPAIFELLSFVTPYGIGLDLGINGKTWIFDVTDYGPVLKNSKRLMMNKGGEWQEEMNIRFAFVRGKPTRKVLSVQQLWPATMYGYTSILNNNHLEPRTVYCEPEVSSIKLRNVSTGHGQEGEFISRTHSLNVNGGATEFIWPLWKECADNAIYPQGGTWVYDRAGWCPGAPSDLREYEIMPLVTPGSTFTVDYGLSTASGDSRYIVNTQLVKYGENSFSLDGALTDIIAPSDKAPYTRYNPGCADPVVVLKNNGSQPITSAKIRYSIQGGPSGVTNWSGNLVFLKEVIIRIPVVYPSHLYGGKKMTVVLEEINNQPDTYANNNSIESIIPPVALLTGDLVVGIKTNAMPSETKWVVRDSDGTIVKTSRTSMNPFTLYQDTIRGLSGCYQLQFTDSDDDGISWWANGDGEGFIRAKGTNSPWNFFQPDFGKEFTFSFWIEGSSSSENPEAATYTMLKPNPAFDLIDISFRSTDRPEKVTVNTLSGTILAETEMIENMEGEFQKSIDISRFLSGVYLVRITTRSGVFVHKFVKQ